MIQSQLIYCGDNLIKLKDIPDKSVDLIYIDPPFNSGRDYETFWGDTKEKRAFEDRFGEVQHYINWMRLRVAHCHRVLKDSGSFYYHCDWHADSYVRQMLDEIFGGRQFNTHIIWRRTNSKGLASRSFPNNHDSIFFYTKSTQHTFHPQLKSHNPEYIEQFYKYVDKETGRRYRLGDLTHPSKNRPNLTYEFLGVTRVWRWTPERMQEAYEAGLVVQTRPGAVPALKRYLDEQEGTPIDSIWDDILPLQAQSREALGYPTQKPIALLERIISASSNPGDVVLDAFCGCGTALVAAQRLDRRWIGIDISPTACRVMADRLEADFSIKEGRDFWLRDLPKTEEELRNYPPFEFENWAVNTLNIVVRGGQAIANKAKVGDYGIDGRIYPASVVKERSNERDLFGSSDRWYPVQVKQKDKVGRPDIESFESAMARQGRSKGFFIGFEFADTALTEINRVSREQDLEIIPIRVSEILEEQVLHRL